MKASAIEFRLRMAIMTTIIVLGFWAPWIERWHIGSRIPLLEWLALELARSGLLSFTVATPVVILFATLIAAKAAITRIWGTAYLGAGIVNHAQMQAGAVMAAGPYRYVRNPLYLGLWMMVVAMAFIMPLSGAIFAIVLSTVFLFRLILGEEAFLAVKLGEPYLAYKKAVPRLIPRVRTNLPRAEFKPAWLLAVIAEIGPIGIFLIIAGLSWQYNNWLMVKAVIVSFGVSIVAKAFLPQTPGQAAI
ncbi:MAG: isoprenylcysteine carboxylmethyltransferase family protein [Acidobacteriota bacterium]|nr:isoprenylcysteine carboxylmethyltransferase family protein [Acidobacteriota bacterium]